ncbi:MAG TPA: cupin domain-containing protein [Gaiella sp.]|nr:cupin domain-containing protein [Gaiella sp.]
MDGLTIKHDDELERAYGKWVLVRRSLGIGSFGINAVELPPGESIPEHDESRREHEEVFVVLDGEAVVVVEGVDHPVRRGSYARLDPALRRTVRNDSGAVARVLIISAPVASGYEPLEWA